MTEENKDKWEVALEKELAVIRDCQKENGVISCLKCEKILACQIHEKYVKVVYESMNKGSGGGFEF